MNEYIIVNKTAIESRIVELEKARLKELGSDFYDALYVGKIDALKHILSQSTPLIPEIEKAYDEGMLFGTSTLLKRKTKQDYISNLKLDI